MPAFLHYEHVCERARCRSAVKDAVDDIRDARDRYKPLVDSIAKRYDANRVPISARHDTMAQIQFEQEWWANEMVKTDV